eukprot:g4575.t1
MDKAWSGSPYCSNRDYVAGWAQYVVTFATTVNTLCAITFVPILGSLSDKLGRRFLLVLSQLGYFVFLLCLGFAATLNFNNANSLAIALVIFGAGVNGGTSVFGLGITNMIIDVQMKTVMIKNRNSSNNVRADMDFAEAKQRAEDGIGTRVGIFQGIKAVGASVGAILGLYYTTRNLESYAALWFSFAVPLGINIILACFAPETLLKTKKRSSLREKENLTPIAPVQQGESVLLGNEDINDNVLPQSTKRRNILDYCKGDEGSPCASWPLICGNSVIRRVAAFVFFFIAGASCIVITQVFMTTQFEWTSTETTLALMSSGVIALISLLLSGKIIKCFGSLKALSIAASLATVGLGLMSTGPFGPLPFMLGLYVLMSSFFGAVAYIQFIAARVRPGSMGAIQGGLSTFASLGFIIGSVAFTALFTVLKEEQRWLCFLVGCFISAAGCVSIITIPGTPGKEVEPQNVEMEKISATQVQFNLNESEK